MRKDFLLISSKVYKALLIALIASPFFFYSANLIRYNRLALEPRLNYVQLYSIKEKLFDYTLSAIKPIAARLSFIETSIVPMQFKDEQINSEKMQFFYKKHSLKRQIELFLNTLIIGDPFLPDSLPNLYYRYIFLNEPIENVASKYVSINLTLPVYFYMFSNLYMAILLTVLTIVGLYILAQYISRLHPLFGVMITSYFYGMLVFFDLADTLITFSKMSATILSAYLFSVLIEKFSIIFIKKKKS